MNVVIVEDESLAADRLEELLKEVDPSVRVTARLGSVESAAAWLSAHTPDLLFLDIQLSDGLSFAIFDRADVRCPVIFTTAYDQYAIRAFTVNSIDYLLKPVGPEDLRRALTKYRSLAPGRSPALDELLRYVNAKEPSYKERFLIRFGETMRTVRSADIAYFYALEKGVFAATAEKKHYPVDQTLDALETALDPKRFFRINRKMIVAYDAIAAMVPYSRSRIRLTLTPEEPRGIEALVSVERSAAFKEWMDK